MKYSIRVGSAHTVTADCLVLVIWNKGDLNNEARAVDGASARSLSKLLRAGDFDGKLGDSLVIHNPVGVRAKRLLLVGGGEAKKFTAKNAAKTLRSALQAAFKLNATSLHLAFASVTVIDRDPAWLATRVALEAEDCSYRYDTTKSLKSKPVAIKTISLSAAGNQRKSLERALKLGLETGKAINHAKQLGNLPANICTPTYLAKEAQQLDKRHATVTTSVLSEKQMQRLGMGSLLSVSAGSVQEAKLIVMQYKGAAASSKPHVLVGKGITFDTGGISLKPGLAMDEMKFDMCGAASVIATMGCVAALKLPINVVGIVAASENMPGSQATKPGDIVTSMSGKTIEILNTDAEGRLVLCDALTYAERFKPRSVIDIATLTGAAVATFGSYATAMLSNNDKLAAALLDCGQQSLDPAWQLPLWDEYQGLLDSNFADIANIGGPRAGTITAACFLSRFTEKFKWAHLDIAGSAWNSGAQKGATGRPVGLLVEYLSRQRA
jgi:leucyl aminopeptidase